MAVSPLSPQPRLHQEADYSIELTAAGQEVVFRARGGAAFVRVNFEQRTCLVDVLNWSHVDVGARKAAAAATGTNLPPRKRARVQAVEAEGEKPG